MKSAPMIEYLHQIKQSHIGLAMLSGTLFALRGLVAIAGRGKWDKWANWAPVRYLSYTIDTALLTAALMLLSILHRIPDYPWAWLWAKLALLVAYVVLGIYALRKASGTGLRIICYVLALLVFVQVYYIARTHHPLGFFAMP